MTAHGSVCVIGAQGVLGKVVMEQFASAGWTVYPAGRRPDQRDGFRQIDLDRPETVGQALQDVDLVISTVPDHGYTAERAILDQGGVLVNCSHARARVASELAAKSGEPKGTVLLNGGLVPGIANLAAAELLARYPQADCLEIAFTVLNEGTAGSTGGLFAYEGLTSRPHHRVVNLPLPRPFGELTCIELGEDDDYGFEGVAGTRRVENYLGFGDAPLRLGLQLANSLRLMRLLPKMAFTSERGQKDAVTREPTAVWVGARRGNERLGSQHPRVRGRLPNHRRSGACVWRKTRTRQPTRMLQPRESLRPLRGSPHLRTRGAPKQPRRSGLATPGPRIA